MWKTLSFLAASAAIVAAAQLTVRELDVGLGQCGVIKLEGGKTVMIDAGPPASVDATFPYLAAQGVATADVLIVSHAHSDHYGGVSGLVARGFVFGEAWDNDHISVSSAWVSASELAGYTGAVGAIRDVITAGWWHALGPMTTVECLYVNGRYKNGAALDTDGIENDASAVILLTHGIYRHLFPADISTNVDLPLVPWTAGLHSLVAAHHGLNDGTSAAFLSNAQPLAALFSVPPNTTFPSPETVDRVIAAGAAVYLTNRGSDPRGSVRTNIVITTDGLTTFTVAPSDVFYIPEPVAAALVLAIVFCALRSRFAPPAGGLQTG